MHRNSLHGYISDRIEKIKKHLNDFGTKHKTKSLHLLRIEIKKIRAVVSFAERFELASIDIGVLKPLFGQAGKIRELSINRNLLGELPEQPELLQSQLKSEEDFLIQQFIDSIPDYLKSIASFINSFTDPAVFPSKKQINKYFARQIVKAYADYEKREKTGLHRFRKRIKKLMYIYEFLPLNLLFSALFLQHPLTI